MECAGRIRRLRPASDLFQFLDLGEQTCSPNTTALELLGDDARLFREGRKINLLETRPFRDHRLALRRELGFDLGHVEVPRLFRRGDQRL